MVSLGAGQYKGDKSCISAQVRFLFLTPQLGAMQIRSSLVEQRNNNPKTSPASLGHLAVVGT